jgi:transcription factor SFP1
MNALNDFQRQEELVSLASGFRRVSKCHSNICLQCRDYQCCGVNLTDMHALVDHFEECHVVVVDPFAPQGSSYQNMPSGMNNAQPPVSYFPDVQSVPLASSYTQGSFDPDDMELDMDNTSAPSSGSSSPPDTPISTPLTSYPSAHSQQPLSMSSSPVGSRPISAFDTTTVMPSRTGVSALSVGFPPTRSSVPTVTPRAEDAFNAYAGYSDYSSLMPGTVNSSVTQVGDDQQNYSGAYGARTGCVPPALLLNSSATTPASTPDQSRVASPVSGPMSTYPIQPAIVPASSSSSTAQASSSTASQNASQTPRASTTLSRPATSLLLSKPFKCPKPNCNKSYKQANGLKYHMTHGSCNFAPPKDLEQLQALLASKRSQKSDEGEPLSDAELREVEKEAERRLRPYACGVGDCQRRYKNMNGLSKSSRYSLARSRLLIETFPRIPLSALW